MNKSHSNLLEAGGRPAFRVERTTLPIATNLSSVHFSDELHGWVAGGTSLYKTEDGGKTWQQITVHVPSDAVIKNILFVSPSQGWITIQKESGYVLDYPNYRALVMYTSNGGETWSVQYDEKQVSVTSFAFADEENGWLVGIRYLSRKGVHHQPFVFRTNNHGQVWSDVSEKIVRHCSEYKDGFGDPINDGLMGIVHGGSDGAVAVSANGLMFRTRDRGTNWELLGSIPDEDEQAGIRRFGANANKFWWVAGTRSIEGTRGILAMGGVGSPWSSFVLSGVNFTDAAPLSSDEFVISGESLQPDSRSIKKTNGVILHSSDGGKNWKTIFSDSEIGRVNAVSFVSGKIWAVADKGTILNLTPLP